MEKECIKFIINKGLENKQPNNFEEIKFLLFWGFELGLSNDYTRNKKTYVLAMDTSDFVEKFIKGMGRNFDIICPDCHYNNESTIEFEVTDEEVDYIKGLQEEWKKIEM